MLGLAVLTYIGASTKPETTFSDIRTIVMVLVSLWLPFLFISRQLIAYINARKVLLVFVMMLLVIASLRTIYEIYPKSIYDPINVAEDSRLGSTSIYVTGDFVKNYHVKGGIIWDYNVLIRIGPQVSSSNYETRLLDEPLLQKTFVLFPEKSILIFSIAGIRYPSIYHSSKAYMTAYNFSIAHNILYNNGVVLIVSQKESVSKP